MLYAANMLAVLSNTVCEAIGPILNRLTAVECSNYFANSGYNRDNLIPFTQDH